MLSGWLLALAVAASPGQCGPGGCGVDMNGMSGMSGMNFSPGMGSGSFVAGQGEFSNPYDAVSAGGGGGGDQLYPFDSPEPWLHGYFQELPAYAGYSSFRPHNYKHVLSQMEVASRWGISPVMAYSHQWYHKYRQRSGMHPNFGAGQSTSLDQPAFGNMAGYDAPIQNSNSQYAPASTSSSGNMSTLQQAAAFQRGYTDSAIPGITTPYYQRATAQPASERSSAVPPEYLGRMDQLQKQLDEQTFQMQQMQQRLQAQDKSQLPAWQQPNHMQFQNDPQVPPPRQLQQFAAAPAQGYPPQGYPAQGYQELTAPGVLPPSNYGQAAQQQQQQYPEEQPMYQPAPSYQYAPHQYAPHQYAPQYQNSPQQTGPQNYELQPGYQQPAQNVEPPGSPAMMTPQGPIMQLPPGQAYFSAPQNTASGYAMPSQQRTTGTHAVWQQNAEPQTAAAFADRFGTSLQQQYVPPTQQAQQQPFQQLQYTQPGANSPSEYRQPAYQQLSAPQGAYYR
ncbi:MAG: hypothetical protein HQ518_23685 [Rhodopirellula sp.]|nr:hypothetical protein [Rhodopirellula sp.]